MRRRLAQLIFLLVLVGAPLSFAQEQWFARSSGVTSDLWGVAYGNNTWVTVGEQGTILTSADGVTWTKRSLPAAFADRWLTAVTYANRLWVAVGGTASSTADQGVILTSPDAITWTPRISNTPRLSKVAYGNGTFIALNDSGGHWASLDGVTWNFGSTSVTSNLRAVVYGAPVFVTTGINSIQSTFDGAIFTNRAPNTGAIEGLAFGRKLFVAVGTLGLSGNAYTSRDGLTWSRQPTTGDLAARGACFFNNQFVLVGAAAHTGGGLASSFDGIVWTERSTGLTAGTSLLGAGAGVASAIAVGEKGTILQSPASLTAPSIATEPSPVTEAVGGNVAFSVTARGSFPLAYQWRRDGRPLAGATDDTLFLPNVQPADAGNYSCAVTNSAGEAIATPATLNVVKSLPIADPTDNSFLLPGASLTVATLVGAPRVAAAQADGKLILGGNFTVSDPSAPSQRQFGLARLNLNGAVDRTFNLTGIDSDGTVLALAVQPDGKILVGGSFATVNSVSRRNLARLNSDGSLDSSFSPSLPSTNPILQIGIGRDARILLHHRNATLTRLNPDGTADITWTPSPVPLGTAGSTVLSGNTVAFDFQSDGKIILAVASVPAPSSSTFFTQLVRLNSDGTLDSSFTPVALGINGTLLALRVLSDGRIMAAVSGTGHTVLRLTPSGAFDTAFTIEAAPPVPTANPVTNLLNATFTPDGRTWLFGAFGSINGVVRKQLARLNADGTLDASFNPGSGVLSGSFNFVAPTSLLALDDGRAVITGDFTSINDVRKALVARLNALSPGGANGPAIVASGPLYREHPYGAPLSIPVNVSGSAPLTFDYTSPTSNGFASTDGQISLPAGLTTVSGAFTVTARSSIGYSNPRTFFVRIVPSTPIVTVQPIPLQTNLGRTLSLSADFVATGSVTYQWFKGDTPIPGATSRNYTVSRAALADGGDYTLLARNELGSTSSRTVHVGVDETARFINLATRGNIGGSGQPLIVGFVTAGPGDKRLLLRAVGPTLGSFGVAGTLADPVLSVYNASGALIYTNDDWGQANDVPGIGTADTRLGAFQLNGGSADAAGILTLAPGAYTAVIRGKVVNGTETTGVALAEIYEDDTASSRLTNLSSRGFVGPGFNVMIPAFVTGTTSSPITKKLLIRGVGPALTAFGVTGALANPTLSIVDSTGKTVATNDDWETNSNLAELSAATALLAFPLAAGSKDAALLVTLPPGAYTCVVSGVNNSSGTALVEVYEVP